MDWTATVPQDCVIAPDGSEVRPLLELPRGGLSQCTLPAGGASRAVRHRTIEEIWFFSYGRGEVWRKLGEREEVVPVGSGVCLSIPTGAHFQFRNTGDGPLVFLIATMPPWPGEQEAVRVADHWPAA
jgi:mannose-6-phosphate isomerase-like protein (cupin superfamily)